MPSSNLAVVSTSGTPHIATSPAPTITASGTTSGGPGNGDPGETGCSAAGGVGRVRLLSPPQASASSATTLTVVTRSGLRRNRAEHRCELCVRQEGALVRPARNSNPLPHPPPQRRANVQKAASGRPAQTDGAPAGASDLPGIRDNHATDKLRGRFLLICRLRNKLYGKAELSARLCSRLGGAADGHRRPPQKSRQLLSYQQSEGLSESR
jgi:hypothetical protein